MYSSAFFDCCGPVFVGVLLLLDQLLRGVDLLRQVEQLLRVELKPFARRRLDIVVLLLQVVQLDGEADQLLLRPGLDRVGLRDLLPALRQLVLRGRRSGQRGGVDGGEGAAGELQRRAVLRGHAHLGGLLRRQLPRRSRELPGAGHGLGQLQDRQHSLSGPFLQLVRPALECPAVLLDLLVQLREAVDLRPGHHRAALLDVLDPLGDGLVGVEDERADLADQPPAEVGRRLLRGRVRADFLGHRRVVLPHLLEVVGRVGVLLDRDPHPEDGFGEGPARLAAELRVELLDHPGQVAEPALLAHLLQRLDLLDGHAGGVGEVLDVLRALGRALGELEDAHGCGHGGCAHRADPDRHRAEALQQSHDAGLRGWTGLSAKDWIDFPEGFEADAAGVRRLVLVDEGLDQRVDGLLVLRRRVGGGGQPVAVDLPDVRGGLAHGLQQLDLLGERLGGIEGLVERGDHRLARPGHLDARLVGGVHGVPEGLVHPVDVPGDLDE